MTDNKYLTEAVDMSEIENGHTKHHSSALRKRQNCCAS